MRRQLAAVAALVLLAVGLGAPAVAATALPYQDAQSVGAITLYNKAGAVITKGSVRDKPFAWRAVSSWAAPAPYNGVGHKATLLAYQPRKGAPVSEWSGDTLTASTGYPDAGKPTVRATATDFTLADFLGEFPPRWDGLIELRIYLGVPNQPTLLDKYASADLKITGDRWAVVRAGPAGKNGAGSGVHDGSGGDGGSDGGASGGGTHGGVAASGSSGVVKSLSDTAHTVVTTLPGQIGLGVVGLLILVILGSIWRRRRAAMMS